MRSLSVLIKDSFKIYKERIKNILPLVIILFVLVLPITYSQLQKSSTSFSLQVIEGLGTKILDFLGLLFSLFFILIINSPATTLLKDILHQSRNKLFSYIVLSIMFDVIILLSTVLSVFLGFILVIFAGTSFSILFVLIFGFAVIFILDICFVFAPFGLVLENKGVLESLKYSFSVINIKWWRTFCQIGVLQLIKIAIIFLVAGFYIGAQPVLSFLILIAYSLFFVFFEPFSYIFEYLIYKDLTSLRNNPIPVLE